MDQNHAMALVASGLAQATAIVGDKDTTGWTWEYFNYMGDCFAVRYAGDLAIAVEVFDTQDEADEHREGWEVAEDRAMGLDAHEDADESEFVYTEVEG